ncbi:ubiquinol cytochrome c reductase Fe-S subunit [Luteibacter rhizovicinus]|uniref:High-potential iron-sulfur protein n=1 Tax=Luteibacter rhizovicinus TaxID=242606 RepID=A0A4R3YLZ7_9GAMM|nr:high-potential iron-sulfur protein [Luteibacter rhizovicinus]TCV93300.1 ubiquinol cytochrome c reductase Fe-S subunit [Luteibacter rhizovicinus]
MSQHDQNNEGRRRFLKVAAGTVAAAAVVGVVPRMALAADLPHLATSDPTAAALKYVEDAGTSTDPKHKAGDTCANCNFYQGKAGDAFGPCQLFPGKAVAAKGWCVSHAAKAV